MSDIVSHVTELEISVSEHDFLKQSHHAVSYLLMLAGLKTDNLVFSGHASTAGLIDKEREEPDEFGPAMPDEASDYALPIYFGDFNSLSNTYYLENPLYYAKRAHEESGNRPRLDVYDLQKMRSIITTGRLLEANFAWLTEEQVAAVKLGEFVFHLEG